MALDEFFEPEVAVAVVVTAAVTSPPVRKVLRRGLVYGLAGLLTAGDKITAAARSVAQKAQLVLPRHATATVSRRRRAWRPPRQGSRQSPAALLKPENS